MTGFYLLDLQNMDEMHFIYNQGQDLSINPDLSFTAASVIKISIMISVLRHIGSTIDTETTNLLQKMIIESGNAPADWLSAKTHQ